MTPNEPRQPRTFDTMKISVAMATYNGEAHIAEQLDSIVRQTRVPDEVILSDDGSTDRTAEIAASFAGRLAIRCEPNEGQRGPATNFLTAIGRTTGDLVILSDQDDRWLPEKVERLAQEFAAATGDVTVLYHSCAVIDGEGHPSGRIFPEVLQKTYDDKDNPIEPVYGMAMAFSGDLRPLLEPDAFALAEGSCGHDEWIYLIGSLFGRVLHLPDVLGEYRIHTGNTVGLPVERAASPLRSPGTDSRWVALRYRGLVRALSLWQARGIPERLSLRPDFLAHVERVARIFAARAAIYDSAPMRPLAAYRDMVHLRAYGPRSSTGLGWRSALKDGVASVVRTFRA